MGFISSRKHLLLVLLFLLVFLSISFHSEKKERNTDGNENRSERGEDGDRRSKEEIRKRVVDEDEGGGGGGGDPTPVKKLRTPITSSSSEGVVVLVWHPTPTSPLKYTKTTTLCSLEGEEEEEEEGKQGGGEEEGCPDLEVKNCPIKCTWTYRRELLYKSSVVLVHHPKSFLLPLLPPLKYSNQMWAVFGDEPTTQNNRPFFWDNPTTIESLDFSFHWGSHSDVQLTFFDFFSKEEEEEEEQPRRRAGGKTEGRREWWKKFDAEREWNSKMSDGRALSLALKEASVLTSEIGGRTFSESVSSKALASLILPSSSPACSPVLHHFFSLFPTASYSSCLNNAEGNRREEEEETESRRRDKLLRLHPFSLAVESSLEAGFVTAQVFEALRAGTVPIYLGRREILGMVPTNSIVYAFDFPNIESLVSHLKEIASSSSKYLTYHAWRKDPGTLLRFSKLSEELGRSTAPCRLCQFYVKHQDDPFIWESQISWNSSYGWTRTLTEEGGKLVTLPLKLQKLAAELDSATVEQDEIKPEWTQIRLDGMTAEEVRQGWRDVVRKNNEVRDEKWKKEMERLRENNFGNEKLINLSFPSSSEDDFDFFHTRRRMRSGSRSVGNGNGSRTSSEGEQIGATERHYTIFLLLLLCGFTTFVVRQKYAPTRGRR